MIFYKTIIRRFLKYFKAKYCCEKKYWEYFKLEKDFYLLNKKKNNGLSPLKKLEQSGITNAKRIINFPCIILDDFLNYFKHFSILI